MLTVVDNDASSPDNGNSGSPLRIEAEDMTLSGYKSESRSVASGDAVVSVSRKHTQGSATTQFTGDTGTYNVVVGYYDEKDGQSSVSVEIGNQTIDSSVFDQDLGNSSVSSKNFVERTIATSLQINNGENITLNGEKEGGERARFDYIEFIPVAAPEPAPAPAPEPAPAPAPAPEPAPGTLSFSDTTYSINEDGTTQGAVIVTRSSGSDGAVSVTVTPSNGTATADNDYDSTPITVDFADGETEKTINISIVDDSEQENDETINLTLSSPTGGATLGTEETAVLTVVDNDASSPDNGLGGDNTFNGGPGDDNFVSSSGNNSYDGGEGKDTVIYASNKTSGLIASIDDW
ncbi:MAG: hypothetical protein F6K08_00745 [Okeania sp. SIO1H6]|nr:MULTISPECIES: Calx-beta domain-containing protein [unclassified Okeania]NES74692.1 hypothetical protein [Okeania sp. SIO1H4]NET11515.1 hypothetical protein [Okeania sp. SIO1H6]NET18795.1 hypothetical protein [Okeania sp. SIO1H5]NET97269.1 hypothetical protein [Okeania sp. SIO1H2]